MKINYEKGITLVALVITIIILIILAGVSINIVFDEDGIIQRAKKAAENTESEVEKEQEQLEVFLNQINKDKNETKGDTNKEKANIPLVLTGMTPIKFKEPTETTEGQVEIAKTSDQNWYNYEMGNWANTQTKDGSMWVWIPRYAYKITYYTDENKTTVSDTKTNYGSIDVKFLIGTTDEYYDENGNKQTAKRQTKIDEIIDTTENYTVHPAFTNESSIGYANGGWKEELTGIWIAKFEAGFASGNNTATVKSSSVQYTEPRSWVSAIERNGSVDEREVGRNWLDGVYSKVDSNGTMTYDGGTTKYSWLNGLVSIKYPTFQGVTYAMNYINHNDCYNLARVLTEDGNIYGFNSLNADSHLMKNSEWGAVSYLSQSQYGLNGENIYINNVTLDNSTTSVYAVTGMAGNSPDAEKVVTTMSAINNKTVSNVYTWKEKNGTKASSTGTIYGIYDLSGGLFEKTASFVANGEVNLTDFGNSIINGGVSTEYTTAYPRNDQGINSEETAGQRNYEINTKIYGDATRETSIEGSGWNSWYGDYSYYPGYTSPFFIRGARWTSTDVTGVFAYGRHDGSANFYSGLRPVLIAK